MVEVVDYGFVVGDRVAHLREPELTGTVTEIDSDYDHGGVTTCRIHWDDLDPGNTDIQWTNKLVQIES